MLCTDFFSHRCSIVATVATADVATVATAAVATAQGFFHKVLMAMKNQIRSSDVFALPLLPLLLPVATAFRESPLGFYALLLAPHGDVFAETNIIQPAAAAA